MAMQHPRFAREIDDADRVVELVGTPVRPLAGSVPPVPANGPPDDHPALRLLRDVADLRTRLEIRTAEVAAAYERECDLIRVLHGYVLRDQE